MLNFLLLNPIFPLKEMTNVSALIFTNYTQTITD